MLSRVVANAALLVAIAAFMSLALTPSAAIRPGEAPLARSAGGNSTATQGDAPQAAAVCWKGTHGRGVGKPISACASGLERSGALCYPACKAATPPYHGGEFRPCVTPPRARN